MLLVFELVGVDHLHPLDESLKHHLPLLDLDHVLHSLDLALLLGKRIDLPKGPSHVEILKAVL